MPHWLLLQRSMLAMGRLLNQRLYSYILFGDILLTMYLKFIKWENICIKAEYWNNRFSVSLDLLLPPHFWFSLIASGIDNLFIKWSRLFTFRLIAFFFFLFFFLWVGDGTKPSIWFPVGLPVLLIFHLLGPIGWPGSATT